MGRRLLFAVSTLTVLSVTHGFLEDLLKGAFGNQRGGGGRRRQQQQNSHMKFPRGVPYDVGELDEEYDWMKGTTWNWNDWRDVTFEYDGTFTAPTKECQQPGSCRWSAGGKKKRVYILWGNAGLHILIPKKMAAVKGNTMHGQRKRDKDKCHASYVSKKEKEKELDFYEVLGVDSDATDKEIKKSFRKLSIKYHPDRDPSKEAADVFGDMRTAYEVLGDKEKRILYDMGGMEAVEEWAKEEQGGGRAMDPFAAFFGGGQQRNSKRGEDTHLQFTVSLDDLYNGNNMEATIERRVVCRGCKNKSDGKCASCGRCPNEIKMVQRQMGPGMVVQQQMQVASKERCKEEETTLDVTIERGMNEGTKLTFRLMGEQTPGKIPGDIIFVIKEERHRLFRRNGDNLEMTLDITLKEALLGFRKEFTHLDGHKFEVAASKVSVPDEVLLLPGEGMPVHNFPSQQGHLKVKLNVVFPQKLTKEQMTAVHDAL